jgi:hypothetical protein
MPLARNDWSAARAGLKTGAFVWPVAAAITERQ